MKPWWFSFGGEWSGLVRWTERWTTATDGFGFVCSVGRRGAHWTLSEKTQSMSWWLSCACFVFSFASIKLRDSIFGPGWGLEGKVEIYLNLKVRK